MDGGTNERCTCCAAPHAQFIAGSITKPIAKSVDESDESAACASIRCSAATSIGTRPAIS
jgi:hypothetical protein